MNAHAQNGRTRPGTWFDLLVPGTAYFVAAKASLLLAIPPSEAAPVWPAAGIAIAAVVLRGYRVLPGLAVATTLFYALSWLDTSSAANLARTLGLCLALACGPLLQAAFAGYLVRRFVGPGNPLVDDRSVIRLLLLAGPVGCLVAASVNLGILFGHGIIPAHDLPLNWLTWWIGDSIGAMLVTPMLLVAFQDPAGIIPGRRLYVGVPLVSVLLIVFVLFGYAQRREHDRLEQSAGLLARNLHSEMRRSLAGNFEAFASLKSFVEVHEEISREHFETFARGILSRQPNLQALEWIPRVTDDEREAFERDPRDPVPITESSQGGEPVPAGRRAEYYPIRFVVPLAGNERARGYDVSSNPVALEAQMRALTSRQVSATAPIRLIQETAGERGIVAYAPVLRNLADDDTAPVRGLVAGVLRVGDYLTPILARSREQGDALSVRILDGATLQTIYQSGDFGEAQALDTQYGIGATLHIDVAGRNWRIEYLPVGAFFQTHASWTVWIVLTGGLLFTAGLGGWLLSLTGRTAQIRRVVDERTGHLRQEIAARKAMQDELAVQASQDQLTGLPNRWAFERQLRAALERAREDGSRHVFCFLDLDQFKVVNDMSGHVAGDELLRQLGAMLRERIRRTDTIARLGGDEFGILVGNCGIEDGLRSANAIREAIEQFKFPWENRTYSVGCSIGLVGIGPDSGDVTEVLRQADSACYAAKDAGRNRIHVYTEDDEDLARRRGEIHWVTELNAALDEDRFVLHAQPIEPIQDPRRRPGVELLVRLIDRNGRLVPPGAFLPAAERYDMSARIDRWVVRRAVDWLASTPSLTERIEYCAINLSGRTLSDPSAFGLVSQGVTDAPLPSRKLMFEITETAAITNLSKARETIRSRQVEGCRFALDDFGSGLSSFAYLKTLDIDCLKIDGAFVRNMLSSEVDLSIVESINSIGHVMGMVTVAEFVESEAVLERVRAIGVDYAQGFWLGEPVALDRLEEHPLFRRGA